MHYKHFFLKRCLSYLLLCIANNQNLAAKTWKIFIIHIILWVRSLIEDSKDAFHGSRIPSSVLSWSGSYGCKQLRWLDYVPKSRASLLPVIWDHWLFPTSCLWGRSVQDSFFILIMVSGLEHVEQLVAGYVSVSLFRRLHLANLGFLTAGHSQDSQTFPQDS